MCAYYNVTSVSYCITLYHTVSHCVVLLASLFPMKYTGGLLGGPLALILAIAAICAVKADRTRDIPKTVVPYTDPYGATGTPVKYYTVFGGSESLITKSAISSLLNRDDREYRLHSEKDLAVGSHIELPDKTSWSATYWLYRAQQRNFLYVADKLQYTTKFVMGTQMDTGHKADDQIRKWREDTLDQIDEYCASRTDASSFQIRDSMNAVELLKLQLECQESLYTDLGGVDDSWFGKSIQILSSTLDARVLNFYGHTDLFQVEEHKCSELKKATRPDSTILYDDQGRDFLEEYPAETTFPCTDETGTIPVWFMWQTHSQHQSFAGQCFCGGNRDVVCTAFQFCHASREPGETTTQAFCNYAPSCPTSVTTDIGNENNFATTTFNTYKRGPICGLLLHGLYADSKTADGEFNAIDNAQFTSYTNGSSISNNLQQQLQSLNDDKITGILGHYTSFVNETGGVYKNCKCGSSTCPLNVTNQYCFSNDADYLCSNAPFQNMSSYSNSALNLATGTVSSMDYSSDVQPHEASAVKRLCGNKLCDIGELCDTEYGCVPVQTYNFSDNVFRSGYPQCPVNGTKWIQGYTHNITECLCKNQLCGVNKICLPELEDKCHTAPPCDNQNGSVVCNSTYCGTFGSCACGREKTCLNNQTCAHFNPTFTTNTSTASYECFEKKVALCGDVNGIVRTNVSCYCGKRSSSSPICRPNEYCRKDPNTGVGSCQAFKTCENAMTNLPELEQCFCGILSTKSTSTTCQRNEYCFKHPSGNYACGSGGAGGSVFRIAADGASLNAEQLRARSIENITFTTITIGCRDPTACNYNPAFDYDSRKLAGECKYPEFGKTCLGDCIIKPPNTDPRLGRRRRWVH